MGYIQVCLLIAFLSAEQVLSASVHDANTYMDSVINTYLLPETRSLDPKALPNFSASFKTSTLRVRVNANYTRGEVRGLTSVKRKGDCHAPYWSSVGTASLNCTLTFNSLDTKYDLTGKYGILPTVKDAVAHGKFKDTDLLVEVTTTQQRNFPQLRVYNVRSLGKLSIDYDHLSTLNTAESSLKKNFGENVTPLVLGVVNNEFRNKLADTVSKLTMPLP